MAPKLLPTLKSSSSLSSSPSSTGPCPYRMRHEGGNKGRKADDRCAYYLRWVTLIAAYPFVLWLDGQLKIGAAEDGFIGLVSVGFDFGVGVVR
ncbi:hypothetical protein Droror1_Dr00014306 [Drosera rotundifolia]